MGPKRGPDSNAPTTRAETPTAKQVQELQRLLRESVDAANKLENLIRTNLEAHDRRIGFTEARQDATAIRLDKHEQRLNHLESPHSKGAA